MPFSWGAAARGADDALQRALAERYAKTQEAEKVAREIAREQRAAEQWTQTMQFNREAAARANEQFKAQQEQQKLMNARQAKADARGESQFQNQFGTKRMISDFLTARPPGTTVSDAERTTLQAMAVGDDIELPESLTAKPRTQMVHVPGPGGRGKMAKLATDEELAQGVSEYVEPPTPRQGPEPNYLTLTSPDGREQRRVTDGNAANTMLAAGWRIVSGQASADKPSTGMEKRALNFFNRAQQADTDLEGMEENIRKLNLSGQAYQALAPNFVQTELGQQYTQAQRAFTEARLRKDSGAAIPEHEFDNDRKTYFVQPGDSPATIAQKRRARATMLASLGFESGKALGEFAGDPDEAKRIIDSYKQRAAGEEKTGPKVGERRIVNGVPAKWDGQGWLPE